jgi:hypothetical protein
MRNGVIAALCVDAINEALLLSFMRMKDTIVVGFLVIYSPLKINVCYNLYSVSERQHILIIGDRDVHGNTRLFYRHHTHNHRINRCF